MYLRKRSFTVKMIGVSLTLFLSILSIPALARTVNFTGEIIEIYTATDQITEVVFPAFIKKVVTNFNPLEISIEYSTKHLYLQPILTPEGNLFVPTENDTSYPLFIRNVRKNDMDTLVVIKDKEWQIKKEYTDENVIAYMRELLTGQPTIAQVLASKKVVFKNDIFKVTVLQTYEWAEYTGYICEVTNLTEESIVIPIQQMTLPDLKAVAIDQEVLPPKGSTYLYMLVEI